MKHAAPAITFPPGINRETFLRDYWQQKPLLMRSALPADALYLTPEELAGLACEEAFESRLIVERDKDSWEMQHGPFDEDAFATLPPSHWTLLVQDVDKYLPEVADLADAFDFVPSWRIDDIMISYAGDQGGVGPHTDAYDVFLMQAKGRRRWRLSYHRYGEDDLVPDLEQRILSYFETDEEWILQPGDVLYLPPGIAHWGIAEGECMTYSLGFRAPSQQDIAADWFQHLVSLSGDDRLQDPSDLQASNPAQITASAMHEAARLVGSLPAVGSREFQLWLGRYLSEPKPQFHILPPEEQWRAADLLALLSQGKGLSRHPFTRVSWASLDDQQLALFCQGESLVLPTALRSAVQAFAECRRLDATQLSTLFADHPEALTLALDLLNAGVFEPDGIPDEMAD